jgi:hypothetical protein
MAYENIYARRIPSGLGGSANCGADQQWDPNYVVPGTTLPPGQCTPKGSAMTPAPSKFDAFMSSLFPAPAPAPAPTAGMTPAQVQAMIASQKGGMSTTTMIAIGVGAVGLLALIMVATRK